MPLIDGSELTQRIELVLWCISGFGENRVEHRRGVAFGKDKSVALRPLWVLRIVAHHATKEQRHQNLDRGQRSAGMARLGGPGHFNNVATDLFADLLQFGERT